MWGPGHPGPGGPEGGSVGPAALGRGAGQCGAGPCEEGQCWSQREPPGDVLYPQIRPLAGALSGLQRCPLRVSPQGVPCPLGHSSACKGLVSPGTAGPARGGGGPLALQDMARGSGEKGCWGVLSMPRDPEHPDPQPLWGRDPPAPNASPIARPVGAEPRSPASAAPQPGRAKPGRAEPCRAEPSRAPPRRQPLLQPLVFATLFTQRWRCRGRRKVAAAAGEPRPAGVALGCSAAGAGGAQTPRGLWGHLGLQQPVRSRRIGSPAPVDRVPSTSRCGPPRAAGTPPPEPATPLAAPRAGGAGEGHRDIGSRRRSRDKVAPSLRLPAPHGVSPGGGACGDPTRRGTGIPGVCGGSGDVSGVPVPAWGHSTGLGGCAKGTGGGGAELGCGQPGAVQRVRDGVRKVGCTVRRRMRGCRWGAQCGSAWCRCGAGCWGAGC